ncbi:MAG: glycoside-pentoside-hexuronide (GPH):cation symporter [Puniceicoccaceae bacterium]|nr:glycoside-pentoside-hexuronide (GPH):cation symporter [Puniceicoccaceae bacterium]
MNQLKLSTGEKIGYGLGDTASNLYFKFFEVFLVYYYTDIFGLNPAAMGTMFLVANLWDAINDPLMGAIADRTNTKNGKYRPYLLWFAIPYGLTGWLIFANFEFLNDPSLKLIYAYATFILFKMVYTAINVPYSAMMGVISADAEDRQELGRFRFLGAFGGGFLIFLTVRPLVELLGKEDEALGFQLTMGLFGIISILCFYICYKTTRERITAQNDANKVTIKEDLLFLIKNKPWIIMFVAGILTLTNVVLRGSVTIHYCEYYLGWGSQKVFLWMDITTLFLSTGTIAFIAGCYMTKMVLSHFTKKFALTALTIINAIGIFIFFIVPPEATTTLFTLNLFCSFIAGPTPAIVWALYTDVADYGEWKYGRRATGLVFSAAQFAQKMGITIAGSSAGFLLAGYGYIANQEQTDEALLGIRIIFCILPGALALANGLLLLFYPLSQKQTEEIQAELAVTRASQV